MSISVSASVEKLAGLKRRVRVTLPFDLIEPLYTQRLQKLVQTAKVDGFRPGKVPLAIVQRQVGNSLIFEIAQEQVKQEWSSIVDTHHLRIVGTPELTPCDLEDMELGSDVSFFVDCEVYPEFQLPDFASAPLASLVPVRRYKAEVTEFDVDAELELMRREAAEWKAVERPAAINDRLSVEMHTYFQGQLFEPASGKTLNIDLDESPCKAPFNTLQHILLGSLVGDERETQVLIPALDRQPLDNPAHVLVKLVVRSVSEPVLPNLDDAFAVGIDKRLTNLADLRLGLGKKMQIRADRLVQHRLKTAIMTQLLKVCEFEVPRAMLDDPSEEGADKKYTEEAIRATLVSQLSRMGAPHNPWRSAEERVRAGLILSEVIRKYEIECDDQKIQDEIEKFATLMGEDFGQVLAAYSKRKDILSDIGMAILEDLGIKKIADSMQVEETVMRYSEVVRG